MFYALRHMVQLLKYKEDRRCVAVMAAVTAVFLAQWLSPRFHPVLFALSIVLSLQVAVHTADSQSAGSPLNVQADPSALLGLSQLPVLESQVPTSWHSSSAEHTTGLDDYRDPLRGLAWDALAGGAGVPVEAMRRLAERNVAAERVISCWARVVAARWIASGPKK